MKYTRQQKIEQYVLEHGCVSLDALSAEFGVSKNTLRRDIAQLVLNGRMEKVYGGARAVAAPPVVRFSDRNEQRLEEKKAIGALAARSVNDHDVIFLDSGTTTIHILPHIAHLTGVTVLTNNLNALNRCLDYPHLNTIAFGGQLNPETASFSSNYCSMDNLRCFNINKAFMAATGISVEKGATNSTSGELVMKKAVMAISGECILLADADQFGRAALLTYAPLSAFSRVVTDKKPDDEFRAFFAENGTDLVYE